MLFHLEHYKCMVAMGEAIFLFRFVKLIFSKLLFQERVCTLKVLFQERVCTLKVLFQERVCTLKVLFQERVCTLKV